MAGCAKPFVAEPVLDRRAQRASGAGERAGCEREAESGRELDERLQGWPFEADGGDVSVAREARVLSNAKNEAGKLGEATRRREHPHKGNEGA